MFSGIYKYLKSKVCFKTQKFLQFSDMIFKDFQGFSKTFKDFQRFIWISFHIFRSTCGITISVLDTHNAYFGYVFGPLRTLKVQSLRKVCLRAVEFSKFWGNVETQIHTHNGRYEYPKHSPDLTLNYKKKTIRVIQHVILKVCKENQINLWKNFKIFEK